MEVFDNPREKHTVCVSKVSKNTASVDVVVKLIAVELFKNLQRNEVVAAFTNKEA